MPNINNFFDPTEPDVGDNTGAWVRGSDGALIETVYGGLKIQQTVSKKLRIDSNFSDIEFDESASYQNLYTYNGSGLFYSFALHADTDRLQVRFRLDGETIFQDISKRNLEDLFSDDDRNPFNGWFNAGAGEYFNFTAQDPIAYNTSVTIDVRRDNGDEFEIKDYLIVLTKET